MAITPYLSYLNILFSVVGTFLWIYYYIKYKQPAAIAPVTWLLNLLAFSIAHSFLGHTQTLYYAGVVNLWVIVLQVHAAVLLITAVLIMTSVKIKTARNL